MVTVLIRVHPDFKKMLKNTQEYIKELSEKEITMEDLTKLLATSSNGSSGAIAIKFPVILLPEKRVRSSKNWREKYINIVIEDKPR
jgi:hypothetical protein